MAAGDFGRMMARLRRERRGLALRQFCKINGFHAVEISKIERGRIDPPLSERRLARFAQSVGLTTSDPEWAEFMRLAEEERTYEHPELIPLDDAAAKMPALFRDTRSDELDESLDVDALIDTVRRA